MSPSKSLERRARSGRAISLFLSLLLAACGGSGSSSPDAGTGGSAPTGSGGRTGSGGGSPTGGANGSGGAIGSGGREGTGGVNGSGGSGGGAGAIGGGGRGGEAGAAGGGAAGRGAGGGGGTAGAAGGAAGGSGRGGDGGAGRGGQGGVAGGGAGGHAGVGGPGGAAGDTCGHIRDLYAAALPSAKVCSNAMGRLPCQTAVDAVLGCSCKTYVDDATALQALATQWRDAGCSVVCPAILCINAQPGHCNTGTSATGICQDTGN